MAYQKKTDLELAESSHRYRDPRSGEQVVSVTSVVGSFDPSGDKLGAGAGAAVKLVRQGFDHRAVWKAKAQLGSRVHSYASLWIEGKSADVPETDVGYLDAFARFCDNHHPEWVSTEKAVVSSHGYGGKYDAIGLVNEQWTLLDLKTGRAYKPELTLQMSGYRYSDGHIVYDESGAAVDVEPLPAIEACAGLYLHDDGTYDLTYVNADKAAYDVFLSLLRAKQWVKGLEK